MDNGLDDHVVNFVLPSHGLLEIEKVIAGISATYKELVNVIEDGDDHVSFDLDLVFYDLLGAIGITDYEILEEVLGTERAYRICNIISGEVKYIDNEDIDIP